MTFLYFTWCPPVREPPQEQFALLSGSGISPRYWDSSGLICPFIWFVDLPQVRGLFGTNLPFIGFVNSPPGPGPVWELNFGRLTCI